MFSWAQQYLLDFVVLYARCAPAWKLVFMYISTPQAVVLLSES
jgi:hypothetical protein